MRKKLFSPLTRGQLSMNPPQTLRIVNICSVVVAYVAYIVSGNAPSNHDQTGH